MQRKDVVELIRVDMPDHTDGAFDVRIESDDGGTHITVYIENHEDSHKIMSEFTDRFSEERLIIMLVPKGFLH
jgi:hypothetical protein